MINEEWNNLILQFLIICNEKIHSFFVKTKFNKNFKKINYFLNLRKVKTYFVLNEKN